MRNRKREQRKSRRTEVVKEGRRKKEASPLVSCEETMLPCRT